MSKRSWWVEVDGHGVGDEFSSEAAAHAWVAVHHPDQRYTIWMPDPEPHGRWVTFDPGGTNPR